MATPTPEKAARSYTTHRDERRGVWALRLYQDGVFVDEVAVKRTTAHSTSRAPEAFLRTLADEWMRGARHDVIRHVGEGEWRALMGR